MQTRLVVFDTSVVDLTEELHDPVAVLFGVQLGGGTDINRALTYCQPFNQRPLKRMGSLFAGGVKVITLLALSDEGRPSPSVATSESR